MATDNPNTRRGFLRGLAAVPLAAAPLAAAAAANPDAELIELGRQYDAAAAMWQAAQPEYRAADEERMRLWREAGGCDPSLTHAQEAVIQRWNDFLDEEVCGREVRIMNLPACTIAGLAVKARVLANDASEAWDEPAEDLDWDVRLMRDLVDSVCHLAGIDHLGRPISRA